MIGAVAQRAIAATVAACAIIVAGGGSSRLAIAQTLPTIRVAGCVCDDLKTVLYGIRTGIFRKYGLNVETVSVANGAAALASLIGGSSQVALTSTLPLFQGHSRGVGFTIVAPAQWYISEGATAGTLLVRKDSPIQSGRDLNGKTIAVQSLRDLNWAGTMAWIDATGGDSRTVRAVELPLPAVIPALDDGRVDAGSVQTPFLEEGISSGKVRLVAKTYDAIGKRFEASVYVSMSEFVTANRDAMSRFVHGQHDAAAYTNSHQAEMTDLVASFTKMDPAVVARTLRATDPEWLEARWLQPVIDVAYKYKLIDRVFPAEDLFSSVLLRTPL